MDDEEYEPPEFLEPSPVAPLPERRTSSRIAMNRIRHFQPRNLPDYLLDYKRKPRWPQRDKVSLYQALRKHGSRHLDDICHTLKKKSKEEVAEFINRQKREQFKDVETFEETSSLPQQLPLTPRPQKQNFKKETPIDSWISLTEVAMKEQRERVCTDMALPHLLEYISRFEEHPSPEECDGVDYADIYQALSDLMVGDVPKQMNSATNTKIVEIFHLLQTRHRYVEPILEPDVDILANYSIREAKINQVPSDPTDFYEDCSVNPLHLPKSMFCKNILKTADIDRVI